jgi:organic radical activating enzyme
MNDLEFRQQVLDPISDSFCGAKWYNSTIWLGSGMTTSCHHPPAHKVSLEGIRIDPSLLHNTMQKKMDRHLMKQGTRPAGCEYCWKIEDTGRNSISDRVYKSKIYAIEDLHRAAQSQDFENFNLKTLEISFDRTCQFACSYCNPAFSSTWVRDIKQNGAYKNLVSDGRNHFTHTHDSAQLYTINEHNPYVDAFFKWWERDLHKTLDELRITGGEPLMSGYTWKLIDWFRNNPARSQTRLAINSNLGMECDVIEQAIDGCQGIDLDIYTSMESTGAQAEYIRDGLIYGQWVYNMERIMKSKKIRALHVMCTINALCLESLPEFLDQLMQWKNEYGKDFPNFTLNILRFPSFQSPLILPDSIRTFHGNRLESWLDRWNGNIFLHEHEKNHVQRLIDYLDVVKTPHSDAFDMPKLHNDFRQFYSQYDQRRGKDFVETFPGLRDFYESIPV